MSAMKNRKLLASLVIVLMVVSVVCLFMWLERTSFEDHFLNIMKDLDSAERKTEVVSWFEREYNLTELFMWVHKNLEFVPVNETFERNTDPAKILESGKGRCEEFSILFVAGCLAHGYQSRIVVAVDISNPIHLVGQHVWAEVKLDGWVHVDPSDRVWNEPYRYEAWSWGKNIDSKVKIYAFEEGKYEDVTSNYKRKD